MSLDDSALDARQLARARALLATPVRRERTWPALVSAAAAACAALGLATAMVLAPPVTTYHAVEQTP